MYILALIASFIGNYAIQDVLSLLPLFVPLHCLFSYLQWRFRYGSSESSANLENQEKEEKVYLQRQHRKTARKLAAGGIFLKNVIRNIYENTQSIRDLISEAFKFVSGFHYGPASKSSTRKTKIPQVHN